MIIARYLARQIIAPALGITAIIVFATMSNWLRSWLDDAINGGGASGQLMVIILYYIPLFLQEALPFGFLLGILIGYGRLYSELEMTSLFACGYRYRQLVMASLIPAGMLMAFMWFNNLWLSPWSQQQAQKAWADQASLSAYDLLTVGRFMKVGKKGDVMYVGELSNDNQVMEDIFMATSRGDIFRSQSGEIQTDESNGARYLILQDGVQQSGTLEADNFSFTAFGEYGYKIAEKRVAPKSKRESLSSWQLAQSERRQDKAELQWRLLSPFNFIVAMMLAVPLSRVNPRQSKFLKVFPALIMFAVYTTVLSNVHRSVRDGRLPLEFGIWWVQLVAIAVCILVVTVPNWWRWFKFRERT